MPVKDKKYNRDSGKVLGPVESTLRVALEAFGMAEVSSLQPGTLCFSTAIAESGCCSSALAGSSIFRTQK